MKVKHCFWGVMLFLIAGALLCGSAAAASVPALYINGEEIKFTQEDGMGYPFIDEKGRTQVPIRKPLEHIGAEVEFETLLNRVIVYYESNTVTIHIGENMYLNGEQVDADTSAIIVNDRTYMPIRFVFEALDYTVEWRNNAVYITNPSIVDVSDFENKELSDGWLTADAAAGMGYNETIGMYVSGSGQENRQTSSEPIMQTVIFYNRASGEVYLEPFQMKCRVYRLESGGRQLAGEVSLPPAFGKIPQGQSLQMLDYVTVLEAPVSPGTYVMEMECPEYISYVNLRTGVHGQLPVQDLLSSVGGLSATYVVSQ